MRAEEVRRVGVVGCGLMGSGIVEVCARAGLHVTFVEADAERVAHGHALIARSLARAEERGKLDAERRDRVLAAIGSSTNLEALAETDPFEEALNQSVVPPYRVILHGRWEAKKAVLTVVKEPEVEARNAGRCHE